MILVDGITEYGAELTRGLPGRCWCHMVSDESEDELHAFAARLGMRRAWAQLRPPHGKASAAHYDLRPQRRALALKLGAVEVSARELVRRNFDGLTRRRGVLPVAAVAMPGAGQQILALAKQHNVITADELPDVLAAIGRYRSEEP